MTLDLAARLREGRLPFDGWTIQSETMALADLRRTLEIVGGRLRTEGDSVGLAWFKDWTFHDECPSNPCRFDWNEFDRMLSTDDEAVGFCVGDDLCAFAIFPADDDWLFRIDVPEIQREPGLWEGSFDLTVPLPLAKALAAALAPLRLTFEPATRFFVPSWCR